MRKLNARKYMHNTNNNAVQGRLSENYLTQKIIARNILDMKYSRFMVVIWSYAIIIAKNQSIPLTTYQRIGYNFCSYFNALL